MKTFEQMGVKIPEILLPENIDVESWSCVACDQYTQDREYWKNAEESTNGKPSALNIILPEVYLNDSDKQERIKKIQKNMNDYLNNGVFSKEEAEMVYVERKTAYGRTRKGIVTCIDLETYEWKPFSKALIRATEATIVERIPPRMEIRRGAPIESPHIMLLVNDKENILVYATGALVRGNKPLYSGKLMQNSGEITGWAIKDKTDIEYFRFALETIAQKQTQNDGSTFLFAVGDGNHSLATAKAVWEEYKKAHPEDTESNVRYALVEIVNIYDKGLTFEPIHRVLFNANPEKLIKTLSDKFSGKISNFDSEEKLTEKVKESKADFGFIYKSNGKINYTLLSTKITNLAVSDFQPALDDFMKTDNNIKIDYIHGESEVIRLGKNDDSIGILLPPVAKDSFFETINKNGPLPRKSFSMGEADEKRFYLECRRLFK